jgi:hypothetical protein
VKAHRCRTDHSSVVGSVFAGDSSTALENRVLFRQLHSLVIKAPQAIHWTEWASETLMAEVKFSTAGGDVELNTQNVTNCKTMWTSS